MNKVLFYYLKKKKKKFIIIMISVCKVIRIIAEVAKSVPVSSYTASGKAPLYWC